MSGIKGVFAVIKGFLAAVVAMCFSLTASANTTQADFTSLTNAVTFSNVVTALLAIGAILAALYVARKGVYLVLGMLKSKG
jgi:hypothetical protein